MCPPRFQRRDASTGSPGQEEPMTTGMRQAKRPLSALLAGPYGPPYHPMLVTVPIGAWVLSLRFDVASHFASRPAFLGMGSESLIAAGGVGAGAPGPGGFRVLS